MNMNNSKRLFLMIFVVLILAASNVALNAQGTSVFYQPSEPIPLFSGGTDAYDLDVNFDGLADYRFDYGLNGFFVQALGENRQIGVLLTPPDSGSYLAPLPARNQSWFLVGPSLPPGYSWVGVDGPGAGSSIVSIPTEIGTLGLFSGQRAWMGIEFRADSGVHYGAVLIDNPLDVGGGYIRGWLYDSRSGEPVPIVPEPSTVLLLALAGLGFHVARRRCGKAKCQL